MTFERAESLVETDLPRLRVLFDRTLGSSIEQGITLPMLRRLLYEGVSPAQNDRHSSKNAKFQAAKFLFAAFKSQEDHMTLRDLVQLYAVVTQAAVEDRARIAFDFVY